MPEISIPTAVPATPPAHHRGFCLDDALRLPLNDVRNSVSSPLPCQMAYTPGKHERAASGLAVSEAYGVLKARRDVAERDGNRREVKALDRAMAWIGPGSADSPGPKVQACLTALGGMRGGLALMQREAPDNERVNRCLARMEDVIGNVCVRIGKCDSPPDGYGHGGATDKLSDEISKAERVMLQCAHELGVEDVTWGIAKAMLPQAMRASIAERAPDALAKVISGDAPLKDVMEARVYLSLQNVLRGAMESKEPRALTNAILHLLKAPEYVETDVPGQSGDQPKVPERAHTPFNPGPGPTPYQNTGAPWAYANAPVTVNNDLSEFMRNQPPLQLTDIRNLSNDSFQNGYALGLAHARNEQLQRDNTRLQQQNADLVEQLRTTNAYLNQFAKGADLVRVPRGSSDDNTSSTEQQDRNITPPNGDREPLVKLDPSSPRNPRVPELNRQQKQLDQQNQQDRQTIHRSDQRVDNGGNGNGGPRDNNRPPEDEVDNTSAPINRASNSRLPEDEVLNELNRTNQNRQQQQRLGDTQQRLEGQHDEQNSRLQDRNDGNRLGNAHAPFVAAGPYQEFRHYLSLLGVDVGPLEPDQSAPAGERSYKPDRQWKAGSGSNPVEQVEPSDVKKYVEERSKNAGTPFDPPMKGKVSPVPVQEKTELQKAFDAFFKKSRLISPDPRNAADSSAQHSPEGGATPSARSPGVEAVKPPAPRMFMSRREEELLVPASVRGGVAEGRRDADLRWPLAPAGDGRALHAPLIPNGPLAETSSPARMPGIPALARSVTLPSDNFRNSLLRGRSDSVFSNASSTLNPLTLEAIRGSRIPGATLSRQDSFDDAVESLREVDSITIDSTPHGATSSVEPLRSDQSRAAASPSENARTSQLFTRSVSQMSLDSDDGIDADTFAQMIIKGSRVSRGEITRQQSDAELAASRAKQWERFREEFGPGWGEPASGAASSIGSSESSLSDRLDRDFPQIEPDTDAVDTAEKWKRAASAESHDSGNESPTRLTESNGADATWDPQPIVGVGNRIAPGAAFMAELKQRTALQAAS
ncbi:hypothetical protein ABIA68_001743 [Stenotrophomonas rhizophila]|uniref:hypothetical protein n=1 Tax=Stenotrophomonas rhizophila TaxID=216778 RepID=UPI003395DA48